MSGNVQGGVVLHMQDKGMSASCEDEMCVINLMLSV